jgi:hypothetical protein
MCDRKTTVAGSLYVRKLTRSVKLLGHTFHLINCKSLRCLQGCRLLDIICTLHFPLQILSAKFSDCVSLFTELFSRAKRNFCKSPCKMWVIFVWL